MVHGTVSLEIPASCSEVFDLLHDDGRRLERDSLLRAAYLTDGHTQAALGATSACVGRRSLGGPASRPCTSPKGRPRLAAVKMINRPPLFATWAASIRHEPVGDANSLVAYAWTFSARPRPLAFLLEPLLNRLFHHETHRRLAALAAHFSGQ